ncbi:myosin regulatory light chain 2 [Daktulosphaira vitifoliae]|uniref:myosin regulatory light chain 2 n=1 Tax=Daktulosphaira vitifoliae TaxID=58002 RepID=UPI0021AAEC6C|nr:myosin regulatory light chain 2 [Daktulosphaira vitifoliae]
MADKEKVKKKKVKKEEAKDAAPAEEAPPAPAPEPEAPPSHSSTKHSSRKSSSKKVRRSGSNVFSMFSTQQVAEFKEGFGFMDWDKDGILGKEDLRATWDKVGKLITDPELEEMLGEASGPVNFTQLLTLFAARMSDGGQTDDDETVIAAIKSFDENGKIDSDKLRYGLLNWGDKFSPKEVSDAFDNMEIDKKGMIDTEDLISMVLGSGDDDE